MFTEWFKNKICTEDNCKEYNKDWCTCVVSRVHENKSNSKDKRSERAYKWISKLGIHHYNSKVQNVEVLIINGKECHLSINKFHHSTITFRMKGSNKWVTTSKIKFIKKVKEVVNGRG